jgi:hypothetical protein
MRWDLPGIAITTGLLLPALAVAAWVVVLERRTWRSRRARRTRQTYEEPTDCRTVADIRERIRSERAAELLASVRTIILPTVPIPAQVAWPGPGAPLQRRIPRAVPAPRRGGLVGPTAFAGPDPEIMRRVLEGLRNLPARG